jgi:hypothetical protein
MKMPKPSGYYTKDKKVHPIFDSHHHVQPMSSKGKDLGIPKRTVNQMRKPTDKPKKEDDKQKDSQSQTEQREPEPERETVEDSETVQEPEEKTQPNQRKIEEEQNPESDETRNVS